MFAGIVSKKSKIAGTSEKLGIKRVSIEKGSEVLSKGQSVSINGICSTVVEVTDKSFSVEYMPETLKKTTAGNLVSGEFVNFETSVKAGDPIDGHFVNGHIDCIGCIEKSKVEGESKVLSISIPKEFHKYIAYKGSVAIEGVSLTISQVTKTGFEVSLIPYTLENTTLGEKKASDMLNIETDIIARYLERIQAAKGAK